MTVSRETGDVSKLGNFYCTLSSRFLITHEIFTNEYNDRFSFLRTRNLAAFRAEDEVNLRDQNVPFKNENFESMPDQKNQNMRIDLNYKQELIINHLKEIGRGPGLSFNLIFLKKIMLSTNAINYSTLILSILSLLSIWFEVDPLRWRSLLLYLRDYLFGYLFIYLPVSLFFKLIEILIFISKWLKRAKLSLYKLKLILNELLNPPKLMVLNK